MTQTPLVSAVDMAAAPLFAAFALIALTWPLHGGWPVEIVISGDLQC